MNKYSGLDSLFGEKSEMVSYSLAVVQDQDDNYMLAAIGPDEDVTPLAIFMDEEAMGLFVDLINNMKGGDYGFEQMD